MSLPGKITKLDEVVVNRIAAGEIIQRPANALKELIENSLDAKATNIQIIAKEGGMKLLQIQDNGTGIRKDDMDIVCERFTTSKLQKFEDLRTISTYGFRGEALASISHVALLSITTKTSNEKCAYKGTYVDGRLKESLIACAGNQGTTITIENLFYNVATRRNALSNTSDEFAKITDVVVKYAVHNPKIGFTLKKHGETTPQVRTTQNSTKMNNIRILYGNPVARELLEIELEDESYKFKMHTLITNPKYTSTRMTFILFINNRLVKSTPIKQMLEETCALYFQKKAYPFCYMSLEINPNNVDVNVHPTKHEVRFLHEESIIEKMKLALDEKLAGDSASRDFYVQARLPKVDVNEEVLKEVLPGFEKSEKPKKQIYPQEIIRTDVSDQKLDRFNFSIHTAMKIARNDNVEERTESSSSINEVPKEETEEEKMKKKKDIETNETLKLNIVNPSIPSTTNESPNESNIFDDVLLMSDSGSDQSQDEYESNKCNDSVGTKARKRVYHFFGNKNIQDMEKALPQIKPVNDKKKENNDEIKEVLNKPSIIDNVDRMSKLNIVTEEDKNLTQGFKSYSINNFRREVKLTSVLKLRKEVEDNCHQGLKEVLASSTFVGCIDERFSLIQSGVNLYICDIQRLAEELFYEIMLYDFANHGVMKFSDPIPLYDLAMLGLETEKAGWSEEDGSKELLATNAKELLLEKADMMKEYFTIIIDKRGNLKSLPVLLNKYFPYEGALPVYILSLSTEVDWKNEQPCFQNICRETAKYYSEINPIHDTHDWKYVIEHVLYPAIKESLLPPKHFAHDSTILQIANLPALYKVFERC